MDDLTLLAKNMLLAKGSFNKAYISHWHTQKPTDDETGWKILEVFRKQIQSYSFDYKRGDVGIEQAAWEIFRLILVGQATYTFEEAVGFVKWYEQLKNKIGKGISGVFDFHGDGFSDLCDSYPLAGKELVERALATNPKSGKPKRDGFLDESEITDSVQEKQGNQWHKFVLGENYVERRLEQAAYKAFLQNILGNEEVFTTNEERSVVDYSGHFDD